MLDWIKWISCLVVFCCWLSLRYSILSPHLCCQPNFTISIYTVFNLPCFELYFVIRNMGDEEFEPNEELSAVIQQMWTKDLNRAVVGEDVTINMGSRTFTREDSADRASDPLIEYVNEELFERESYKRFYDLLDNYESAVGVDEVMTHQEIIEMKKFVDVVVSSEPMKIAQEYLVEKDWAPAGEDEFKDWLWDVWFTLYRRGRAKGRGRITGDSSGFEHVFVGEIRNGSVIGFHNWIQFYRFIIFLNRNFLFYLLLINFFLG